MKRVNGDNQKNYGSVPMKCDDIQGLLLDYMNRELGPARSQLIHEHLRKCPACRAKTAEMESAVLLLRNDAKTDAHIPRKLSAKHKARIARATLHPIADWMAIHYAVVSVIIAVFLVLMTLIFLRIVKPRTIEEPEPGIPVRLGSAPAFNAVPDEPPDGGNQPN